MSKVTYTIKQNLLDWLLILLYRDYNISKISVFLFFCIFDIIFSFKKSLF